MKGPIAVLSWARSALRARVDGNSMKVAGIPDGDQLVVDRAAKPVNGTDGGKRGH
jgi:SOS-response transcriptional repressor LexA